MRSYSAILFLSSNAETLRRRVSFFLEFDRDLEREISAHSGWSLSNGWLLCVSAPLRFYNKGLLLNSYAYAPSLIYIRYSGMIKNYNLQARN